MPTYTLRAPKNITFTDSTGVSFTKNPNQFGAELVLNSDFSEACGGSMTCIDGASPTTIDTVLGEASIGQFGTLRIAGGLVFDTAKTYRFIWDVVQKPGGSIIIKSGGTDIIILDSEYTLGSNFRDLTGAQVGVLAVQIQHANGGFPASLIISRWSIKEVLTNTEEVATNVVHDAIMVSPASDILYNMDWVSPEVAGDVTVWELGAGHNYFDAQPKETLKVSDSMGGIAGNTIVSRPPEIDIDGNGWLGSTGVIIDTGGAYATATANFLSIDIAINAVPIKNKVQMKLWTDSVAIDNVTHMLVRKQVSQSNQNELRCTITRQADGDGTLAFTKREGGASSSVGNSIIFAANITAGFVTFEVNDTGDGAGEGVTLTCIDTGESVFVDNSEMGTILATTIVGMDLSTDGINTKIQDFKQTVPEKVALENQTLTLFNCTDLTTLAGRSISSVFFQNFITSTTSWDNQLDTNTQNEDLNLWGKTQIGGGSLTIQPDISEVSFVSSGANNRFFLGSTVDFINGETYVFSVFVSNASSSVVFDLPIVISGIAGNFTGSDRIISFPANAAGRYGIRFTMTANVQGLPRFGIGTFGGSAAAQSITMSKPQIEKLPSGSVFSDWTGKPSATNLFRNNDFVSGDDGLIASFIPSVYPGLLKRVLGMGTGDSFSSNALDWIGSLSVQRQLIDTEFMGQGYPGQGLTLIASNFSANLDLANFGYSVLQGGINDVINDRLLPEMQNGIISMVATSRTKSKPVAVICNIAPFKNSTSWTQPRQDLTDAYNNWLQSYCSSESIRYADIYTSLGDVDPEAMAPAYDSGDGLHPNPAGSDVISALVNSLL